jgi:hypothetical protein
MFEQKFASALAERVQSVVPQGFAVSAERGWVSVCHDDDPGASTGVGSIVTSHGAGPEGLASAASAVLNSVQDYISEELRAPWPTVPGGPELTQPEAVVEGSVLHMWFGDRHSPTLAVSDIDLTELR